MLEDERGRKKETKKERTVMINTVFLIYTRGQKMYARHKKEALVLKNLMFSLESLEASSTKKCPLIFLISIHFSNNFAAEKRSARVQKKILWSNTNKTRKSLCLCLTPIFDMVPVLCIYV
jgi:hypothetical protein